MTASSRDVRDFDEGMMEISTEFLRGIEILSLLTQGEIERTKGLFSLRKIGGGEVLFREGDPGNELFIVRSGEVVTSIRLPDGGAREIAVFREGNFFGEMSIFENAPRSATCMAAVPSELLGLHESDFYRMVEECPDIATKVMYRMLNITTQRLRDTGEFLSDMVHWGEAARRRAITDELTGSYNRRFLDDALEREFERAKGSGSALTMAMVDLDFFRQINDRHGDEAGDRCIIEVVRLIRGLLRENDIIARYGGDEFALLLPGIACDDAGKLAEAIRKNVEGLRLLPGDGPGTRLTLSIGLASYPDHEGGSASLREAADRALYRAKEEGRNRVVRAESSQSVGGTRT